METKTNKKFTWLWLEDEKSTVKNISLNVFKNVEFLFFTTPGKLIDKLIEIKKNSNDSFLNYGLILDIYLKGNIILTIPKEWSNGKSFYIQTQEGYDAGLVFFESMILGNIPGEVDNNKIINPYWNPPPPVIFLTVMSAEAHGFNARLDEIKQRWLKGFNNFMESENRNNENLSEAKVEYVRKWDMSIDTINDIYQRWNIG